MKENRGDAPSARGTSREDSFDVHHDGGAATRIGPAGREPIACRA